MKLNNSLNQIRKSFIDFFIKNGHVSYPSSSLIPSNDPSLMFTNAGMVQFKERFLSENKSNENIVSSQKCLRVGGKHNDLENVGYTNRHHTFFEMLGNFSFGNYFKENAIELAWKFVTQELQLNPKKLYITVYRSDIEAYNIWQKITSFSDSKIIKIDTDDNFWSMGSTGPCGPCSEIFYDYGENIDGGLPGTKNSDGPRFTEIWNLVFMEYHKTDDGKLHPLKNPCIDTGMGLERISAVMQNVHDNYDIDLFKDLILESQRESKNTQNILAHRIIADHTRAAAFLIAEGVSPGNEGRSYVLRRIIRRASRYVYQLNYAKPLLHTIFLKLLDQKSYAYMANYYSELLRAHNLISSTLVLEEENFRSTLLNGLSIINKELSSLSPGDLLPGELAFKLYDTYGFPLDITLDIAREKKLKFDIQIFNQKMESQKKLSRNNWIGSGEKAIDRFYLETLNQYEKNKFIGYDQYESVSKILLIISEDKKVIQYAQSNEIIEIILDITPFYAESGGQKGDIGTMTVLNEENLEKTVLQVMDTKKINDFHIHKCLVISGKVNAEDTVKSQINIQHRKALQSNHSATHLLHHVLRSILGKNVVQKGSLITEDKLRFDFTSNIQLNITQIQEIEKEVNDIIKGNHLVSYKIDTLKNAIAENVIALFGEKYDNEVRIVNINESHELCGGTHVSYSGEIGMFKILSESSIAFGIRRIEAITGNKALKYIQNNEIMLHKISKILKTQQSNLINSLQIAIKENKNLKSQIENLYHNIVSLYEIYKLQIHNINFQYCNFENIPVHIVRNFTNKIIKEPNTIGIFKTTTNKNSIFVIGTSQNLKQEFNASDITAIIENLTNCKGGGNSDIQQIMINTKHSSNILEEIISTLKEKIF